VTQTDVARVAGVHNTTVSLALRNSPLIPAETRKRIRAVAAEMGYCPDPALRALVAYRNSRRDKHQFSTLAYVTNWESKWGWQDLPAQAQLFAGAQRRATEIGFQLEHLWLGEPGMSQRRLSDMLLHRGITGVLLASHRPGREDLSGIDWSRLSAVKIGSYPQVPAVSRVVEDCGERLRLALRQAAGAGYRRIGFVLHPDRDNEVEQAWSTAFYAEQCRMQSCDRIPLFNLPDSEQLGRPFQTARRPGSAMIEDWFQEHRPDVILGLGPNVASRLEQEGLALPDDVAYIDLELDKPDGRIAGIQPNCDTVGALAVDLLSSQLQQNMLGLPLLPTVTAVGGTWCPGASLPNATDARRGAPARCA
jgi:LacI family transcriptional regulator